MMRKHTGLFFVFVAAVTYWFGYSMVTPVIALYLSFEGYSVSVIGLITSINAISPVLLAMPAGSLTDRIGARNTAVVGALSLVLSGSLYWTGASFGLLAPLIIAQILNGIGTLVTWGAFQVSVLQTSANEDSKKRDQLLSNFTFATSLAQFGGPLFGGAVLDFGGFGTAFFLYMSIAALATLFAFFVPRIQQTTSQAGFSLFKSYGNGLWLMRQNKPFTIAIVLNGILFIIIDMRGTFFPLYLYEHGYSNTQVGMILSTGGLASILIRPFIGPILSCLGYDRVMTLSLAVGAFCLLGLVFNPVVWLICAIVFLWGACAGINQPMALIAVARTVQSQQQGMGMSLRTMSNRVVQLVNPLVIGALSGLIGLAWGFGVIGIFLLVTALYTKRIYRPDEEPLKKEAV